jgi:hypothetical protein
MTRILRPQQRRRVDGVAGYRICLTSVCTEGPQFEPGSTHFLPSPLAQFLLSDHGLPLAVGIVGNYCDLLSSVRQPFNVSQ